MSERLPSWPLQRLPDAIASLARAVGWPLAQDLSPPDPPSGLDLGSPQAVLQAVSDYVDLLASTYGLEAELVSVRLREIAPWVEQGSPMLLWLPTPEPRVLVVVRARGKSLEVLAPDGSRQRIDREPVIAALAEPAVQAVRPLGERLMAASGMKSEARRQALFKSLAERHSVAVIPAGFMLRSGPTRPLGELAESVSLPRLLRGFAGTHLLQFVLTLLLTGLVGAGALSGRLEPGWLYGGAILLSALLPLQLCETWLQGRIAVASGLALRQRLLAGALRLPLAEARQHGYGDFIGQIIESDAVEFGLRAGGLVALSALLDLGIALWVSAYSTPRMALALLAWLAVSGFIGWRYFRRRRAWTAARLDLTSETLEGMLGHRTRLVQEPQARWHRREEPLLAHYQQESRRFDSWALALVSAVPSGWLLLGMLMLAPLWLQAQPRALPGAPPTDTQLALAIWCTLLGFRAFGRIATGLSQLAAAAIAWQNSRHLLASAAQPPTPPITATPPSFAPAAVALEALNVSVRHSEHGRIVLRDLTLRLYTGQRLLLQGRSGSGKSTLAAVLGGLLPVESGQLLLGGLDLAALGSQRWRRLVGAAPQFHENHLFAETLAFNLLLGRGWPPSDDDLQEAIAICEELGLGPLLQRMPSGIFQNVGESGWQLSHGERSRVFIARSLLQRSQVVILDESFAALDPATLTQALDCVLRRAPTLLVIAHP